MFWKLDCWENLKINKSLNGTFWLNLKRCKMRRRFIIIECSGRRHFQETCSCFKLYYTLITEHENQVRLFIFSNNYINFKVWQHNLFVQLKLVKICPQNIFLAGQLWVGDGPFGSIFDPQKTGYHCIAYTNNEVWRNFRMAVYNLKV